MAQQDVTYGRWADNPAGCADPTHHGSLGYDGFAFNKLACRTKTTQTFHGGEQRVMVCDFGETKGADSLLTFVRTSPTTLDLRMEILAPSGPILGQITLFSCPPR